MSGDEVVETTPPRPHLAAVFKARGALRWTGSVGPGSPLVGRAHPATRDALIIEAIGPEYAPPFPTDRGWIVMGIPFEDDDKLERGLIVIERAPFVDRYRSPVRIPRELEEVRIETVHAMRATVRVTL